MDQIHYVPFTVDMIGNPAYDLMDILCFEGGFADRSKISCITKYTFHYNAKYSVTGVGTNPALSSAKSKSDKNLSGLMAQVSSITSSINRLIYDYNTGPLVVGQDEQTLGMVTYYISQKADVEGHFLMNYTASESTHLTLRFYDQGVEELYSPLEMDILEGEGSIGMLQQMIRQNATVAQDQTEYKQRFDSLSQKFKEAEAKKDAVEQQISDILERRGMMEDFLRILKHQDGEVTTFSEKLWCGLLDYATAYADGRLTFTFKNGSTFEG